LQYTVMIVEDDEVIAEMVKGNLERWNYEVAIASDLKNCRQSGREAKAGSNLIRHQSTIL